MDAMSHCDQFVNALAKLWQWLFGRPTYPRTHDRLAREATRDPIFLLQEKRAIWHPAPFSGPRYDHDAEGFVDDDGNEITDKDAIDLGAGVWSWSTISVFLTREEGEAFAEARAYNYEHGWRVYCIAADGAMCDALAAATEGGRYS